MTREQELEQQVEDLTQERDAARDDLRIADAERDEARERCKRVAPVDDAGLAYLVAYWTEQADGWSSPDMWYDEADPEHADRCRQIVNTVARLVGARDTAQQQAADLRRDAAAMEAARVNGWGLDVDISSADDDMGPGSLVTSYYIWTATMMGNIHYKYDVNGKRIRDAYVDPRDAIEARLGVAPE